MICKAFDIRSRYPQNVLQQRRINRQNSGPGPVMFSGFGLTLKFFYFLILFIKGFFKIVNI